MLHDNTNHVDNTMHDDNTMLDRQVTMKQKHALEENFSSSACFFLLFFSLEPYSFFFTLS